MSYLQYLNSIHQTINNIKISRSKPLSQIIYVVEPVDWAVQRVGRYIVDNLNNFSLASGHIAINAKGINNQVIHFGSISSYAISNKIPDINNTNKIVLTWFHIDPDDVRINMAKEISESVDYIHTSTSTTKNILIDNGVPEKKIVVIPIGVDLNIFEPLKSDEKYRLRESLGLSNNKIIIGSFQKDGVGWGNGLNPKLIKGPDVFIKVIEKLRKEYDIFVLLSGPSRGYVKKHLDEMSVPYKHVLIKDYIDVPKYYNVLNLYLVTSRVEGGPQALMESMATGTPLVSTRVGMAPFLIKDGYNGYIVDVDDVDGLYERSKLILCNKSSQEKIAIAGLNTIQDYSWEKITQKYYDDIYKHLLK